VAIPEGVETVTVSSGEPMTLPDGTLIRGHIRFVAPDLNLIDDEDFIFGGESPAELCHGEFSITLVAPDATGITPTGWTYTAIGEFENAPGWTRYIDITKADPDVFLDDVIVLTPGDVTYPDTTFVRKVGDTMLGPLILAADPVVDLGAATKQYVDDAFDPAQFVDTAGDTMTGELVLFGNPTQALGAAPRQYVDQAEADAVTAATAAAAAESVSLSGDTMTGPLILSGAPATGLGAATKDYADAGDDARVAVAGDTMTGPLVLSGNPSTALQAAPKQYVDAAQAAAAAESVSISGDTMTGPLVLNANPSLALGAAPKQYVDAAQAAAEAESVSIDGDTMTGELVLFGNPTVALGAAPRQYVDQAAADAEAAAAAESVSLSGDTMTGPLVLNADPSVALGAATKQYVDGLDAQNVKLTGNQTVAGVKTFSSIPVGPATDPVTNDQLTRKFYVDTLDAANVKLTGNQTVAGVKTFSSIPVGPSTDPTLADQLSRKFYVDAGDATNAAAIADVAADLATLDGEVVKLTGDQTVAGIKTFSSIPVLPASDPTTANQATRKSYVDTLDAQNVKLTGAQTVNGVKTFGSIPVLPGSDPVAANEATRKSYVDTLDAQNVKITGNQNVSGIKTFANTVQMNNAVNGVAAASLVGTDVFDSWQVSHRGRMGWGTGAATRDAFFERIDVGVLQATSQIRVTGAAPLNAADLTRKDYVDTLDAQNVKLTGNQTVAGVKTFSSIPVGPASDPTTANELTRKSYVDTLDAQNVKLTGSQTVAGVKTFSSIPVLPASDPTLSEQATRKTYVDNKIVSEMLLRQGIDTGVIWGGEVNVNGSNNTQVDIGATIGIVADYLTTPSAPTMTVVNYAGATGITVSDLVAPVTWFMLSSAGVVSQQTTRPTNSQRRTHIQLGAVVVASGVIIADQSVPSILPQTLNQLYDLMDAIGPFNVSGNIFQAASTNLTLAKTSGTIFDRGFNHFDGGTLTNNPHISTLASQNPVQIRYATQLTAPPVATVTSVIPGSYDNAGTITAMPGSNNTATIQRIYGVPLNTAVDQIVVQYGQTIYASLADAIAAIGSEQAVRNPNLQDAVLLGYIAIRKGATDLSNPADARIVQAAKISGNSAGSADSLSLAVLIAGSTMTGPLILNADPSAALGAATKQYVDGLDGANVKLTGAQTVAGVKTFSSIPVGPASDPTTGNQLTRKTYVDNLDAANVKLTGAQTVAGIKTFSSIPVLPASDPVNANDASRKSYVDASVETVAGTVTALDGAVVKLTGDQSVAGIKTFSSIPVGPNSDPTTANQLTRKSYVDTLDGANVKLTGAQSVAGVKTFSSIPVLPGTDPTAANEATRKSYVDTLDGANVKTTGNQSISGVKTFSTGVVLSAGVNSTRSAIKTAATSRNTTASPAADPDLVVAVEANSRYEVTAIVGWTNGGGGMRFDFTGPTSATMLWVDNDGSVAATIGTDLTFSVTVGTTLKGTLITAGSAGNLTLRWAQNTSNAGDTTLLAGCGLHVERVA